MNNKANTNNQTTINQYKKIRNRINTNQHKHKQQIQQTNRRKKLRQRTNTEQSKRKQQNNKRLTLKIRKRTNTKQSKHNLQNTSK